MKTVRNGKGIAKIVTQVVSFSGTCSGNAVLSAMIAVLALLVLASAAHAADWYVDGALPSSGNGTSWATAFKTVGEGITAASAEDTINVAAGTYNETLVIDKQLTLVGAGPGSTIVQPTDTPAAGVYDVEIDASGTIIHGFGFDFNGAGDTRGGMGIVVGDLDDPPVTNVQIIDNTIYTGDGSGPGGTGIQTGKNCDVSGLIISGNIFYGDSDGLGEGVFINPYGGSGNVTIENNEFYGYLFSGVSIEASNVQVTGNIINSEVAQGYYGVRFIDLAGAQSYGNVLISDNDIQNVQYGIRVGTSGDVSSSLTAAIESNTLSNNNVGVWVRYGAYPTITDNDISGNTQNGVNNEGTTLVVAEDNWWGDRSGPYHPTTNPAGTGNSVSDNVDYDPWLSLWFVDADVASSGDGTSWATAFKTIQEAIDASNPATNDEIWVKQGTYLLSSPINLGKAVAIYGGFLGTDYLKSNRAWQTNVTTVDGQDSVYHCFFVSADASVDGLTITGGNATGTGQDNEGGGMHIQNASPSVANCIFSANSAGRGGGMFNAVGSPAVTNCTFNANSANFGGGMLNFDVAATPTVTKGTFTNNTANESGGGIANEYGASPTITNCIFRGNSAGTSGGGIDDYEYTSTIVTNCTFTNNSASSFGGAMANASSSQTVTNCILWGDAADSGNEIYNSAGSVTISYSDIQGGIYFIANVNGGTVNDGGGNIISDPLFVPDLHLQAGSQAINAGTAISAPPDDIDGEARPCATGHDMGADEFCDSDSDGIPDFWEIANGLDPQANDWSFDPDIDGLSNRQEYQYDTDPHDPDTDGDGVNDGQEIAAGTDPNDPTDYPFAEQGVFVVDGDNGDDGNSGKNWANAKRTIQAGIDVCESSGGDEVWVKEGIYVPGPDRTDTFELKFGVAVYGGFDGTETSHGQRDWAVHVTVLSGDVGILADPTDNTYHVVTGANDAILDGFTITAGKANGDSPNDVGGGLYNYDVSPTVNNCTFVHNTARVGAGMFNDAGSAVITNCTFSANNASDAGGAIYNSYCSPIIINCQFLGNSGGISGGAVYNRTDSTTLANCTFSGNSAQIGGGLYLWFDTSTITNCTFSGNQASSNGAGIGAYGSEALVTNCILWGNSAPVRPEVSNNSTPQTTVTYANVDQDGYEGTNGNIRQDPLFADPAGNDFHLQSTSPCIDAGTNSAPGLPDTDFEGDDRIIDGDNSGTETVDMGADEVSQPSVWYVDGDVASSGDGTTWATAFKTISEAAGAAVGVPHEEIWVKQGTYLLVAPISLAATVGVYGGFDGTEALKSNRDWKTNVTTVDGQDLVHHCFLVSADGVIDGFTITGGNANGTGADDNGAGIYNSYCSPTINNCILSANSATNGGGGIYNDNASPTITNCVLFGNNADYGAGIYNFYSSPTITNCTVSANSAINDGGAMYNDNASPIVANSILWGDTAAAGAEIYDGVNSSALVGRCDIDQDGYVGIYSNIREEPLFVDEASSDFRLQRNSPCIDAGINSHPLLPVLETDFEGDVRILDGDNNGTATVDIGADEAPQPAIWHVDANVASSGDGTSWTTAFKTIQEAVDAANAANYDSVWVKQGTHIISSPINLDKAVTIFGGFDGTETLINERDWKTNVTIVDGQAFAYHCFLVSADGLIDGLTITGGNANGSGADDNGAGIYNSYSSPTINNCILSANSATNGGGAIYNDNASATITNCVLFGNNADYGAGIYNSYSSPTITNCTVSENSATTEGGAIYNDNASPTVENSILWGDSAAAGIEISSVASSPTVSYCDIDQAGYEGSNGNIRQDPLFADAASSDFHLQPVSPCIDAGTDTATSIPEADFEGHLRVLDGDNDGTPTVDMGVDEHLPPLNIAVYSPDHGPYRTLVYAQGARFGDSRTAMIDSENGYSSFVTFSGPPGTLIALVYPSWSDTLVKVKFKYLFIDSDGDCLRDVEPVQPPENLPPGVYTMVINTIYFHDLNSNGTYDQYDELYDLVSGNPKVFTLTDEPVIYSLTPSPVLPGEYLRIMGFNFGDGQGGTSVLRIHPYTLDPTHPAIKLWSNTEIRIKLPHLGCGWFKRKDSRTLKMMVTVDGKDSNITGLTVLRTGSCP